MLDMVERLIRDAVNNVGFWASAPRQAELRGRLVIFLDENELVDIERAEAVAARLMDLARANQGKLLRGGPSS